MKTENPVYHMRMPAADTAMLEKTIGIRFRNKNLLHQSLTHRSAARKSNNGSYERLEFLGDAVLELAVTEFLFATSNKPEGELTNWRSALVQGEHLAQIAEVIHLGKYLHLSKGEESSGGREKESTLADALEALIGAIFLDRGFKKASQFINTFIISRLRILLAEGKDRDAKSTFQEKAQEKRGITPVYKVLNETGPDHDKTFTVAVFIENEKIAEGKGASKQKAEQQAAERALETSGWDN